LPGGELVGFAGSVLDITDRRQAEEQLRSANAALVRQLEEQIRKEQVIEALGARLIGAQEEERKRLARELHDDLNQQIAALSIAMGNLKRHLPEQLADARAQSDRIHQKLVQVAETVRRMSHELHPAMLQYSGLAAALQSYCNEFGALTGIAVSVTIEGEFDGVPSGAALCMYRVTQEALRNIAKHAKVAAAAVEMRHSEGLLSLTVSDQGVGMDPASAEATAGLGLVSIRERARFAGGSVEIASQPNQGTAITVRIQD
jgi:signal transduction histidine kinase